MNRILLTALVAVCLVVTACNDDPVAPVAGPDVATVPQMDSGLIVVESVTGNAHLMGGNIERTSVFNIFKYDDGTVDGWYHSLRRGHGGGKIRVRIECLRVVGNEAWATGVVVDAAGEENIGRPYSFYFCDNGEGAGATPDKVSIRRFEYYDCQAEPDLPERDGIIGNIQVHG